MSAAGTSTLPPLVVTAAGPVPQQPSALLAQLIAIASQLAPGYTASLPGSLVEDVSSTEVAGLVLLDQARVEAVNAVSPLAANPAVLVNLGQVYGVSQGIGYNTSVNCVFTGTVGFPVPQGFTVSDGTYQYIVQNTTVIGTIGSTPPVYCLATQGGTWAVPAGTVTTLITSVPDTITLSVTNPLGGIPGSAGQSVDNYRAQVLQAGQAISQGMTTFLRTLLGNVPGVQPRLVSPLMVEGGGWEIVVGGGDPYAVANAIFAAVFDVSTLVGSTIEVTEITSSSNALVTTDINHGYTTGQSVTIADVNPSGFDGTYTVTYYSPTQFYLNASTVSIVYIGGGVCTPNDRNVVVDIIDYPNTYAIPFVVPPQQAVSIVVTWNTSSPNPVSNAAIAAASQVPLAAYVNSIYVGLPMNVLVLQSTFQAAVANIVPASLLSNLAFSVSIDGLGTAPEEGTTLIFGDPESFFFTDPSGSQIVINQG